MNCAPAPAHNVAAPTLSLREELKMRGIETTEEEQRRKRREARARKNTPAAAPVTPGTEVIRR